MINHNINDRFKFSQVLNILIIIFLAIVCWVTHFWDVSHFGLYEDDYTFVGQPISVDLYELIELIKGVWFNFTQGRPIGFSCSYILAAISFSIGGLIGVYCAGYSIVLTNTLLFYWLMWRLSKNLRIATIAGLTFCLFPADTTATFLTHSLGLYCCITFFLLATHAYISNYYWLAYLAIAASLLSYETCLLLFLVVPLFKKNINLKKELIHNGFIVLSLLFITIGIRKLASESRIIELDVLTAVGISLVHTLTGPFVSFGMYLYRPIYTVFNWRLELFIFVPIAFIGIFLVLFKILSIEFSPISDRFNGQIIPKSRLWLAGTLMLFLAYPLTIILQAGVIDGRASRVHLAAIIGGSMLCTLAIDKLLLFAKVHDREKLGLMILSLMFALLVGFGLIVQSDYRLAWQNQQQLVTNIIKLCPDLEEGTSIFVEQKDFPNPIQIAGFGWSMPLILEYIYQFPPQWRVIPRIYPIHGDWQNQIDRSDNLSLNKITEWLTFIPKQHPGIVKTQDVIKIDLIDRQFIRTDRLLLKNGIELKFKPRNPNAKLKFPTRPLYPYLISPNLEI